MQQHTEQELEIPVSPAPTEPGSENLHLTPEEADAIFRQVEAEIQPILRKMRKDRFTGWIQGVVCASLILFSLAGIVWQAITYPHTLVVLYTKANPASITATLDVPTRTLAPITITRSLTAPTTGHGHQDAQAASGTLTFYNGLFTPQYMAKGTVFTGRNGVQVTTDQAVTLSAATPPQFSEATSTAHALTTGQQGNIQAGEISTTLNNGVLVKNDQFIGGRDARDYRAVAQRDLDTLTASALQRVNQSLLQAFILRPGEQAQPTTCHTTTTTNHGLGQEAQTVTVKTSKTCSAMAYSQDELTKEATAAFTHTKPAANYHLVGSVQTTVHSISPVSVTISGKWVYTFSPDYQQLLAQQIEGDSPAQARKVLVQTGVISDASIPSPLPPAMYINFLVLVG